MILFTCHLICSDMNIQLSQNKKKNSLSAIVFVNMVCARKTKYHHILHSIINKTFNKFVENIASQINSNNVPKPPCSQQWNGSSFDLVLSIHINRNVSINISCNLLFFHFVIFLFPKISISLNLHLTVNNWPL